MAFIILQMSTLCFSHLFESSQADRRVGRVEVRGVAPVLCVPLVATGGFRTAGGMGPPGGLS